MLACRVLLVDDHREVALALSRLLRERGVHVKIAHNTESARMTLQGATYDVVLLELTMLDCSGTKPCRKLPTGVSFKALPTVFAGEKLLELTPIETRIFGRLYEALDESVGVDELCAFAWPTQKVTVHTLHTRISLLRRKLAEAGWEIANSRGYGYRLTKLVER